MAHGGQRFGRVPRCRTQSNKDRQRKRVTTKSIAERSLTTQSSTRRQVRRRETGTCTYVKTTATRKWQQTRPKYSLDSVYAPKLGVKVQRNQYTDFNLTSFWFFRDPVIFQSLHMRIRLSDNDYLTTPSSISLKKKELVTIKIVLPQSRPKITVKMTVYTVLFVLCIYMCIMGDQTTVFNHHLVYYSSLH